MLGTVGSASSVASASEPADAGRCSTSKHYSRAYTHLVERYIGEPIDTSFRELVGPLPADEYTHSLFPYPARLLRHIPRFLLATESVVADIDTVFDPFVGSGTVLLEAQLRGLRSIGIEQNPVAALVSRVKVSEGPHATADAAVAQVLASAKRRRGPLIPSPMLKRWYSAGAMSALGRLAAAVADWEGPHKELLQMCLALTAKRVAVTDPRIPVPVKGRRNQNASTSDVWNQWISDGSSVVAKLKALPTGRPVAEVYSGDSRDASFWPNAGQGARTLLLTSPPYGAAQKYVRSTSLEAAWLGHAPDGRTVHLEHDSIGREHLSRDDLLLKADALPSTILRNELADIADRDARRGAIYVAYFSDMQRVFSNARQAGIKRIALVSGDNHVAGAKLATSQHLADIIQSLGFTRTLSLRDPIRGRTLLTSRKHGSPAAAEYIEIYESSL